jgi:N-acetyl-gamma-glutamyl-phosphate reductase
VLFFALPHGEASRIMVDLVSRLESIKSQPNSTGRAPFPLVIDLSGDFRLVDPGVHQRAYGFAHGGASLQQKFVYGLPELHKTQVTQSRLITNPGCFATACTLGLAPLVAHNLISGKVVMDCVTGSTGAGTQPSKTTHHPERAESYFAYKPFVHQHLPEIEQTLRSLQPEWSGRLVLQTHSGPFSRGIYGTIHGELADLSLGPAVAKAFESFYHAAPLVRLGTTPPHLKWVKGSPFVDISYQVRGPDVLVTVALDNLVKGAAGQAVQNMNLAMGWPETSGLSHLGLVG